MMVGKEVAMCISKSFMFGSVMLAFANEIFIVMRQLGNKLKGGNDKIKKC